MALPSCCIRPKAFIYESLLDRKAEWTNWKSGRKKTLSDCVCEGQLGLLQLCVYMCCAVTHEKVFLKTRIIIV